MTEITALDILIVEDHEPMRAMLRKTLERAGVSAIREAANGAEALKLLASRPADLILADQTMPEMDGLTFVARVRADPRCAHARIVMLSGHADGRHSEAARAAGVDALLAKPIAPRDLLAALNRVLIG